MRQPLQGDGQNQPSKHVTRPSNGPIPTDRSPEIPNPTSPDNGNHQRKQHEIREELSRNRHQREFGDFSNRQVWKQEALRCKGADKQENENRQNRKDG